MTAQEFFILPTNKKTVELLFKESIRRYNTSNQEVFETNPFFNEVASSLRSYLNLPKAVKEIMPVPTTKSIYDEYVNLKKVGYRKELRMPF